MLYLILCDISNTRDSVSSGYLNIEKRVENTIFSDTEGYDNIQITIISDFLHSVLLDGKCHNTK